MAAIDKPRLSLDERKLINACSRISRRHVLWHVDLNKRRAELFGLQKRLRTEEKKLLDEVNPDAGSFNRESTG